MPTLRIPERDVATAVLRLNSIASLLPAEVVDDIETLIEAVDERGSKLFQLARDVRDPAFRDDIYGEYVNANRLLIILERAEKS